MQAIITTKEVKTLATADRLDQWRVRLYGRWVNCCGAADLAAQSRRLRAGVRSAVYTRAGQATGLPTYKNAYQVAGLQAVKAAGLT
jgi:hypothetical protein